LNVLESKKHLVADGVITRDGVGGKKGIQCLQHRGSDHNIVTGEMTEG